MGEPTVQSRVREWVVALPEERLGAPTGPGGEPNLKLMLCRPQPAAEADRRRRAVAGQERVFLRNALKMEERSGLILRERGCRPGLHAPADADPRARSPRHAGVERELFEFNVSSYLPNYEEYITRAVQTVRVRESEMASEVGGSSSI